MIKKTIVFFLFILFATSCEKDQFVQTGELKITINTDDLQGVSYSIYTEAVFISDIATMPAIKTDIISSKTIIIKDLNAGNYYLRLNNGSNRATFLQVTAGKQRTFEIK